MNQTCKKRLARLKTIVSLHQEKKALLASIRSMYQWVLEGEHILDGSWASQAEEISNAEVGRRFDAYLERLSHFVQAPERTEDEKIRLGHLLKVLTHLRPGLVQCYDRSDFPRTNNDMERTIRAIKMHASLASVAAKIGTTIFYGMGAVSPIKNGGSINRMEKLNCKPVYNRSLLLHGDGSDKRPASAISSNSTAFAFVIAL